MFCRIFFCNFVGSVYALLNTLANLKMPGETHFHHIGFKVTFTDPDESVCAVYQKHFRNDTNVGIKNESVKSLTGYDCLIVPLNSGFGLKNSFGLTSELLRYARYGIIVFVLI